MKTTATATMPRRGARQVQARMRLRAAGGSSVGLGASSKRARGSGLLDGGGGDLAAGLGRVDRGSAGAGRRAPLERRSGSPARTSGGDAACGSGSPRSPAALYAVQDLVRIEPDGPGVGADDRP